MIDRSPPMSTTLASADCIGPAGPSDAVASVLAGEVAPDAIRQRIVVIGATVTGAGGTRPVRSRDAGVEVISTAIAHLMTRGRHTAGSVGTLRRRDHCRGAAVMLVGLLAWGRSAVGLVATCLSL